MLTEKEKELYYTSIKIINLGKTLRRKTDAIIMESATLTAKYVIIDIIEKDLDRLEKEYEDNDITETKNIAKRISDISNYALIDNEYAPHMKNVIFYLFDILYENWKKIYKKYNLNI